MESFPLIFASKSVVDLLHSFSGYRYIFSSSYNLFLVFMIRFPFSCLVHRDQKTRLELENLFEAAESGQQDQIRLMLQHSHQLTERKPWLHAKITCTTQKNHRTALHMCVMGAVRALETARTTLRESKETMKNNGR